MKTPFPTLLPWQRALLDSDKPVRLFQGRNVSGKTQANIASVVTEAMKQPGITMGTFLTPDQVVEQFNRFGFPCELVEKTTVKSTRTDGSPRWHLVVVTMTKPK